MAGPVPRRVLWLLLAHHLLAGQRLPGRQVRRLLREFLPRPLPAGHGDRRGDAVVRRGETFASYGELTACTRQLADKLHCSWPGAALDRFFLAVHRRYFKACPVSGRALRDPPGSVLCPFIAVPVLVTLLVTGLVVWRSKRAEGVV